MGSPPSLLVLVGVAGLVDDREGGLLDEALSLVAPELKSKTEETVAEDVLAQELMVTKTVL